MSVALEGGVTGLRTGGTRCVSSSGRWGNRSENRRDQVCQ